MDKNRREDIKNPRQNANTLSVLTFWWLRKLFALGYQKELDEDDLYSPLHEDRSKMLGDRIERAWEKEVQRCQKKNACSNPKLFRVLCDCFGKTLIWVGIQIVILEFGFRIIQPFLLAELLRYFSGNREEWEINISYYAAAFCILPLIDCLITHSTLQVLLHLGMKMRVACSSLLYRKILRLSSTVLEHKTSSGQMVNFLSNDVNRFEYAAVDIHYIIIGPIQTLLVGYILYYKIGWPAIAGIVTFLSFIPIQMYLGRQASLLTLSSVIRTDKRLQLMNQILAGVEIIKMYVWEIPYSMLLEKARRKEVNLIKKYLTVQQFSFTFDLYVPRLSLFVTLLIYVMLGNNINAEIVFMITAFLNVLRSSMNVGFPMCIHNIAESVVSINRIEKFMIHPEISKPDKAEKQLATPSMPIYIKNVTAKWDETREDTLHNVDLLVPSGSLIAVIGQIGSGKSSLLQAILCELSIEKGFLETCGNISYVNQRAWIFASSIRQNILFGQPMDKDRYEQVIRVCQLKPDLDTLPYGDNTIVGERGINLSGGQRARISLARAVYANADIYLFDDPLSAVDPHVSSRIVEKCICGFLKGKTRILVTHQLQYLKHADAILVMNNGKVQVQATYEELQNSNLDFMKIFQNEHDNDDNREAENKDRESSPLNEKKPEEGNFDDVPLEIAETRKTGAIAASVFFSYWKASGSVILIIFMIFLFLSNQTTASGSDYLLAFWVNNEEVSWTTTENGTYEFEWQSSIPRDVVIYTYSILTISVVILCFMQTMIYYVVCMRSSRNLHSMMFRSIIRATMYFFNVNPAGRILNRFSKDITIIDRRLPFAMIDVLMTVLLFLGTVIIIGVVNPWLLIPTAITILSFYGLRVIYIKTSRAVKRMEGTSRSPIFDHVGATLQGLTTIRAFRAEKILAKEFDNHQDLHTSTWYIFISTSRAFGLYIEFFCLVYVAVITILFLVFDGLAVAGDIGLVISQIVAVTTCIQWGIRQTAELENYITSVERVLEYSNLEEEPFLDSTPETKPKKEWPMLGLVEFKDVMLKHGPKGQYVLKGITFTAQPKEKIGVVGRTGAGKTSLINALFRLANVEGEISIDGISTSKIALHDFRSKISIIPQEPVLFGGSLRKNLDPFDEYPDDVLWNALEEVELKNTITDMVMGLNSKVAEDGSNFSVGQRQLLCLARALVRNNRIMVLDEATANVDPQTDFLIQKTVKRKFMDCTVFTIAHRLNTVMDSDKIIVMEQGELVEFDRPYALLQKKGYFYNMVQDTGPAMAASLHEIAKENFHKKNGTAL